MELIILKIIKKLASLNNYLCNYLTGASSDASLATSLKTAIQANNTNAVSGYLNDYASAAAVGRSTSTATCGKTDNSQNGKVSIPSKDNIATELHAWLVMNGKTDVSKTAVQNWVNSKYGSSSDDKTYLANLNNDICANKNIDSIYNTIKGNSKYTNTDTFALGKWDVTVSPSTTVNVNYGTKEVKNKVGTKEVIDHYEEVFDHNEYAWDSTDPDIANAIAMYAMAKRGVIVVTEEQASSYNWLTNMVNAGEAVFTTFNPSQVAVFAGMSEEAINNMTDAEYEDLMGIKNTSVSVETFIREVNNEKDLKKAEAQYEADMLKIDKKDRRYDTELAKLENERNAIKEEVETLKTVAKENVERTFKLFS